MAAIESKVYGSVVGGGGGAIVTSFVLWLLGVLVWNVSSAADAAGAAISAVPLPVAGVITGLITLGGVFVGGWYAKHTPRFEDYVARRALVEGEQPAPVVDDAAEDSVHTDELLVPEYSTV